MKCTTSDTSDWFWSLDRHSQKMLVCLLFGLKDEARKSMYYALFAELLERLDADYHWIKGD